MEYLKHAGEQAAHRCAIVEAVDHLGTALKLLKRLPDIPQRMQQELELLLILGPVWMALKGYATSEVETTYRQALKLSQKFGTTHELFSALNGMYAYYLVRGELKDARELAEWMLKIADDSDDLALFLEAQNTVGEVFFLKGEFAKAQSHLEQVSECYDPRQHRPLAFLFGQDVGVYSLSYSTLLLALIGDSTGALCRCDKVLDLAQQQAHPASLAFALIFASQLHLFQGDTPQAMAYADAAINLST